MISAQAQDWVKGARAICDHFGCRPILRAGPYVCVLFLGPQAQTLMLGKLVGAAEKGLRGSRTSQALSGFCGQARLVLDDPTWHQPPRCERVPWKREASSGQYTL